MFSKRCLILLCLVAESIVPVLSSPEEFLDFIKDSLPIYPPITRKYCSGAPVNIPDDGSATDTISINDDFKICDVDIYVNIFHDWKFKCLKYGYYGPFKWCKQFGSDGGINDLEVDLKFTDPLDAGAAVVTARVLDNDCIGPDQTVKELFSTGGIDAPTCIDAGPLLKREPDEPLSVFNNIDSKGDWKLEIEDNRPSGISTNGGVLNGWCLIITPCPDGKNGKGMGDPHFQTWAGEWYDFHGVCDLAFLNNPDFADGTGMWIHMRTQERHGYSYIESAAIKIGDDVLEVGAYGSYMLNSISNAEMPNKIDQYDIQYHQYSEKQFRFDIVLDDESIIVIKSYKDLVSVSVEGATEKHFSNSYGLMGSFDDNGTLVGRNGTQYLSATTDQLNEFGMEWQVLDTEDKLFKNMDRYPQYPTKCMLPSTTTASHRRRLGETIISREIAEKACEYLDDSEKEQCVFDIMASNDLELANAWAM